MLPAKTRSYLFTALEASPLVLSHLLSKIAVTDPLWDTRPAPDRFTLRGMLAHLADWEPIFRERMTRTTNENVPLLPNVDEGALALANNYAQTNPLENLARYREGRTTLVAFLRTLPNDAFARTANRELIGVLTLEEQIALIAGHDGYHAKQAIEWLQAAP